jgi:hypothetical protein
VNDQINKTKLETNIWDRNKNNSSLVSVGCEDLRLISSLVQELMIHQQFAIGISCCDKTATCHFSSSPFKANRSTQY